MFLQVSVCSQGRGYPQPGQRYPTPSMNREYSNIPPGKDRGTPNPIPRPVQGMPPAPGEDRGISLPLPQQIFP